MPQMGESVSEGVILEWAKAPGDAVEADETIVEISTDKVDAEVPAPAAGVLEEILAEPGETVDGRSGDRPPALRQRRRAGGGGARAARHRARPPRGRRAEPGPRAARGHQGVAGRPPRGRRPRRRPLLRAGHRAGRADLEGRRAGGRQRRRPGRGAAAPGGDQRPRRRRDADQGRLGDARPLHGRVAVDPDRDLVPHAHRHDARRPPPRAQGRRAPRLLHAPDRLRDRPRGDRGDAGHGPPLHRDRRPPALRRRRRREPRDRRRPRAQGRWAHPHGAGHPRRRAARLRRLPGGVRRPDRARAREPARPPTTCRARTSRSPTPAASARSPRSRG